ncbi:MAG: aldehyde dehydrogenase, partial [Burkholderiaceae bacterium]
MNRHRHFIGGRDVEPGGGRFMAVHDPATEQAVGELGCGDARDVALAVASAREALAGWRDSRPLARGQVLIEIARAIRADAAGFAQLECLETGKSLPRARIEIEASAQYFEYYGGLASALVGEQIDLGAGYHAYTRREPYGVIGVILPWNAPLNQAARACAPALAAGNVVVAKPSEATSGTTLRLARLAVECCGLPPGVFNVVTGDGEQVGEPLVRHRDVRKIAFTGSLEVGRRIAHLAADRILPLTLELGGKSPDIVFADADLAAAAPGVARGFLTHAGQICLAGTRILVERGIHDSFVSALKQAMQAYVADEPGGSIGPMTTRAQYEKVQAYYRIASEEGAVAELGGALPARPPSSRGWFVAPTLYTSVRNDMRIAREEVFG